MTLTRTWLCLSTVCLVLSGCGGGGGGSSAVPTEPTTAPPTTPQAPIARLLTDAELETQTDPSPAQADTDAAAWVSSEAKVIRSLTVDDDFSDLAFLQDLLVDKRMVQLGESTHGAREFSQAKLRLIKYLHEELGYNTIAFESGVFDCEQSNRQLGNAEARVAMNTCLFAVWETQVVLELFEYIGATQQTATPLRITGFDVQFSGAASRERAAWVANLITAVDPDYGRRVQRLEERLFSLIADASNNATGPGSESHQALVAAKDAMAADYLMLADYMLANRDAIVAASSASQQDVQIAAQIARTSPALLELYAQRFAPEGGGRARDRGMAENLIYIAEQVLPEEKIIVWAHNAHIRHDGAGFLLNGNMGHYLHEALGDALYTIGLYMYRGRHAFNDRSIQTVQPPLDRSLEATFYPRRLSWLFLDVSQAPVEQPGTLWLDRQTPVWAWGSRETNLVLRNEYSGLLFIDTVRPPSYL